MPKTVIYPSLRLQHTSREAPSREKITNITRCLTQVLCREHLAVRDMIPTHDGYKILTNTQEELAAIFGIGEELLKIGLRIQIPPEIRAKMTLVIRPVNPQLLDREFVRKALTDKYPWADIADIWTGDRNRVLKITLHTLAHAERLKSGGILIAPYSFRSFDIEFDEYYHLPECTWCYRLKAHATSKCPHRSQIWCSICGCDGHRFHSCPNREAVPSCLNCARAGEEPCDHRTRSNSCPARKRLVQELRDKTKAEGRSTFPPAPESMDRLYSRAGGVEGGEHAPKGAAPKGQTKTSPHVWSSEDGPMPVMQARMLGCLWVAIFRDAYEPGMFSHVLSSLFEDNLLPRLNIREGILDGKRLLAALNLGVFTSTTPIPEDLTGQMTQQDLFNVLDRVRNTNGFDDQPTQQTHKDQPTKTKSKKKKPKTKTDTKTKTETKDSAPHPPHLPNPSLEKSAPLGSTQVAPTHEESILVSTQVAPTHEESVLVTPKPKKTKKPKTKSQSNLFLEPPSPPKPETPPIIVPSLLSPILDSPLPPHLTPPLPHSSFPPPRVGRKSPMSDPGSLSSVSSLSDSSTSDESLSPLQVSPTSSPSLPLSLPPLPSQPFPDTPCISHLSTASSLPNPPPLVDLTLSPDPPPLSSSSDITIISTPSSTIPTIRWTVNGNAAPRRTYTRFSPVGTRSRSLSYSGRAPSSQRRGLSPPPTENTSSSNNVQK